MASLSPSPLGSAVGTQVPSTRQAHGPVVVAGALSDTPHGHVGVVIPTSALVAVDGHFSAHAHGLFRPTGGQISDGR